MLSEAKHDMVPLLEMIEIEVKAFMLARKISQRVMHGCDGLPIGLAVRFIARPRPRFSCRVRENHHRPGALRRVQHRDQPPILPGKRVRHRYPSVVQVQQHISPCEGQAGQPPGVTPEAFTSARAKARQATPGGWPAAVVPPGESRLS